MIILIVGVLWLIVGAGLVGALTNLEEWELLPTIALVIGTSMVTSYCTTQYHQANLKKAGVEFNQTETRGESK